MNNTRIKTGTMMFPEIIKLCDENLELANTKSRNDFIEEAIKFYVSYLNTKHNNLFISESIESVLQNSIQITEDRLSKLLFKLSVEMSMMMNIIGANFELDEDTLKKLRIKCIKDVKISVGSINFENIVKYQNSEDSDD
ncbi:hypothetical protein [Anaerorhabdus sp.]|uniref:hypothetical protein n=1 Tax=Anaerorhabdus sp. TaxID=1872524 RepID=UPI002B21B4E6|nr:hypothetical protein [Anaerorhabdus sp.]MEA4875661.1 hypothetical protein [Anaerorhabdus sp.]